MDHASRFDDIVDYARDEIAGLKLKRSLKESWSKEFNVRGNQFHLFEILSGLRYQDSKQSLIMMQARLTCYISVRHPMTHLSYQRVNSTSRASRIGFLLSSCTTPRGTLWLGTNSIDFSQYPIYNFVAMVDYWMREIVADLILGT